MRAAAGPEEACKSDWTLQRTESLGNLLALLLKYSFIYVICISIGYDRKVIPLSGKYIGRIPWLEFVRYLLNNNGAIRRYIISLQTS